MQVTKSEVSVIRCVGGEVMRGAVGGGGGAAAKDDGRRAEGEARREAILDNPLQLKTNMFIRRENPCV